MKPKVFIGSSTEAFEKAHSVAEILSSLQGVDCVMWNTVFEPGFLNFDALEHMLGRCSGAVFIATPDIDGSCRGRSIKLPRPNILLEFGLVAGRLGLRNVALCRFGNAELPSDLQGLTIIDMDCSAQSQTPIPLQSPRQKLEAWASQLGATIDTVPRTTVVHGYSGGWRYQLKLDRWWGLEISAGSFVQADGTFELLVSDGGNVGAGLAQGHIYFKIASEGQGGESSFQGEYRTAHEVTNTLCHTDGSMELTTKMFALQRVTSEGSLPPQISPINMFPEPWYSKWTLSPTSEPRQLEATYCAQGSGNSEGKGVLTKIAD